MSVWREDDQSLSMRLWSTERVGEWLLQKGVWRWYAFIGKCIRGILLPWAMFTEKINFGAGQIDKLWQK